jgi:hypothetical protein
LVVSKSTRTISNLLNSGPESVVFTDRPERKSKDKSLAKANDKSLEAQFPLNNQMPC